MGGTLQNNANLNILHLKYTFDNALKAITEPCATSILFFILNILIFFFDLTLQNDVKSPKSTRHSCPVTWSLVGGQDEIKTVELIIETAPADIDCNPGDKSNSGNGFNYSCIVFDLKSAKATVFTAGQIKIVAGEFPMNSRYHK